MFIVNSFYLCALRCSPVHMILELFRPCDSSVPNKPGRKDKKNWVNSLEALTSTTWNSIDVPKSLKQVDLITHVNSPSWQVWTTPNVPTACRRTGVWNHVTDTLVNVHLSGVLMTCINVCVCVCFTFGWKWTLRLGQSNNFRISKPPIKKKGFFFFIFMGGLMFSPYYYDTNYCVF